MSYNPLRLSDMLVVSRAGTPDGTTGEFDYTADVARMDAAFALDSDPAWADPDTGVRGYPAPKIVEEGIYSVNFSLLDTGACAANLNLPSPDGSASPEVGFLTDFLWAGSGSVDGRALYSGVSHLVLHLPAGVHFIVGSVTASAEAYMTLIVQKVG